MIKTETMTPQELIDKVNLQTIDDIIYEAKKAANKKNTQDLKIAISDLEMNGNSLRSHIADYYEILLDIQRQRLTRNFRDPWKVADDSNTRENRRRNVHNSIISDIRDIEELFLITLPNLGVNIDIRDRWFTQDELKDRHSINSWANQIGIAMSTEEAKIMSKKRTEASLNQPPSNDA